MRSLHVYFNLTYSRFLGHYGKFCQKSLAKNVVTALIRGSNYERDCLDDIRKVLSVLQGAPKKTYNVCNYKTPLFFKELITLLSQMVFYAGSYIFAKCYVDQRKNKNVLNRSAPDLCKSKN